MTKTNLKLVPHVHATLDAVLDPDHRGEVSTHVARYRNDDLPNARWLAEHGPDI